MNKKQYCVDLNELNSYKFDPETRAQQEREEQIIRNFFFDNSDVVRFGNQQISNIHFGWPKLFHIEKLGTEKDAKFISLIDDLSEDFIKKDDKYYCYRLSEKIKNLLSKNPLVCLFYDNFPLHTFENPAFFKCEEIIGEVINHHGSAFLYLTEDEMNKMKQSGVKLDEVVEDPQE